MVRKISVHHSSLNIDTKGYEYFWNMVNSNQWETETYQALDRFAKQGFFVDIGAWVGPLSLYLASKGVATLAVEPDPKARQVLQQNIQINPSLKASIQVCPNAVAPKKEKLRLYHRLEGGDSMSSLLNRPLDSGSFYEVEGLLLEDILKQYDISNISLLKMDIEGGEFHVLPHIADTIQKYKPNLLLSFHIPFLIENYLHSSRFTKMLQLQILRLNQNFTNHLRFNFLKVFYYQKLINSFKPIKAILKDYNFVYDIQGKPLSLKNNYDLLRHSTIVASDEKW